MNPFAALDSRIRGFRVIDMMALTVLVVLVLVVYTAKTHAGGTRADIDRVEQQISDEQSRIRLLNAEVASEEQPERLTDLSGRLLNLAPIAPEHDISPDQLADVAGKPAVTLATAPTLPATTSSASPTPAEAMPVQGGR